MISFLLRGKIIFWPTNKARSSNNVEGTYQTLQIFDKKYSPFFTFFNFLTCYVLASHPILCQTSCSIPLLQGPCPRFLYISITWRRTPLWASTLGQGFFTFPCSSKTFGTISYSWPQSLNRGSSGKCFKLNSLWAV